MTDILICGISGRMGQNILSLLQDDSGARAVCGVDIRVPETSPIPVYASFADVREHVDAVIDFSSPQSLCGILEFCERTGAAAVLATTGYSAEDLQSIEAATEKIAVFRTANFSVGVNLLVKLVREAAAFLGGDYDVEIIEKHHHNKKDAPSGTALMLADSVNGVFGDEKKYVCGREGIVGKRGAEIGIHAVRGGSITGDHDVLFCGEDEVITLSHHAGSRKIFANGAIRAAKFTAGKPAGKYCMDDVLAEP